MRFEVKSEEEINSFELLPEGIYPFKVVKAEDATSQNGNEMIKLQLIIMDENNVKHLIFDYLLPSIAYKLRHFCNSVGMMDKYETGEFCDMDCLNKQGYAHIVIQKGQAKPEGGYYPDKNSVKDYVIPMAVQPSITQPLKADNSFADDQLPF